MISQIWQVLDRRQRRGLLLLQLFSLFMAFSTVVGIAAVLPFFAVLSQPQSIHHNAVLAALYRYLPFHDERSFMIALGGLFVGIMLVANAINLAGALAIDRYAHAVGNAFHTALFEEYLQRDYAFHVRADAATLSSNILFEARRVASGVVQHGLLLGSGLVSIVVIMTSILLLNPLVAVCALGGLGGSYLLIYTLARRRLLRNGRLQSGLVAERGKVVAESLAAIKDISLLRCQPFFAQRFAESCERISAAASNTQAIAQSPRYILECLTAAGLVAVALLLSATAPASAPWLAQLTFVGLAAYRLLPSLQQVFVGIVTIRADSPALNHIAGDLLQARARRDASAVAGVSAQDSQPLREVVLRDVSFRYASDAPPAIQGLTLRIPAGAAIGLIGPNGSGKTTLVDLMLGLLSPQSGELLVDGVVIDDTNRRDWQSRVACVPQHVVLLDTTVIGNIALGVPPVAVDRERLRRAAWHARLDEFVMRLPHGYDEVLGERGQRLSGGQRQRIGIARALYRDASLLVMDEPTHALDESVEQSLLESLESLRGRCALVLISHRLSTLRRCDLIYELRNGKVVASGSHQQLSARSAAGLRVIS
jgi:HlyD family secretion protein